MVQVNWAKIKKEFESEMARKLKNLPSHKEVAKELKELRGIISHELPETAPIEVFQMLIKLLLKGKPVDLKKIKIKCLQPYLTEEEKAIRNSQEEFIQLRNSATKWVKKNLPELRLKHLWENHHTWLPRRFILYKRRVSFQKIAADTLARFCLLKK